MVSLLIETCPYKKKGVENIMLGMDTKKRVGEYKIHVGLDRDPINPRTWDNLTKFIFFHKRYDIGDKHDYNTDDYKNWSELSDQLMKDHDIVKIKPVYMLDHSGLKLKYSSFGGLYGRFDSGKIGYAIVTKQRLELLGTPKNKIDKVMEQELEMYNKYLNGEAYMFQISKVNDCLTCHSINEDILDVVGNFFSEKEALEYAESRLKEIRSDNDE